MDSTDHLHGAEEPGRLQRRVRLIELRRSEGISLGGVWLTIADDPICPTIRDFDFNPILPRPQRAGGIHTIRRLPRDTQRLAVNRHLGKVLDLSQVDPKMSVRLEPISRSLQHSCV